MRNYRSLSDQDCEKLRSLSKSGGSMRSIAKATGIPRSTVRDFLVRENITPKQAPRRRPLSAEVPPMVIQWPPQSRVKKSDSGTMTALLYGDTHFPFHDPKALGVVEAVAESILPDIICHVGDLLDCYHLSRFDKDPSRRFTLQDEIDQAREHLGRMRQASPSSEFILLEGNHEDRLRKALWNAESTHKVLMELTNVRAELTWPKLLGLEDLDIEWVPAGQQASRQIIPDFILKHGTLVRQKAAYTAAGELSKYNRSGASGHTHRLGVHSSTSWAGVTMWAETGCTCQLKPEYASDPDWQAGFVILQFSKGGNPIFNLELVSIIDGKAICQGELYGY